MFRHFRNDPVGSDGRTSSAGLADPHQKGSYVRVPFFGAEVVAVGSWVRMNIVEPIFAQCRNKPADVALCAPGTDFNMISYGRLARSVNNVCQRIVSLDLAPRSRVAVFIDDPIFHAVMLIALIRLGIVTISGRTQRFSWPFSVDAVISDQPFQFPVGRVILADKDWTKGDDRPPEQKHSYRAAPDDICRIFLTSGTTGEEKGVAVSHRMMAARIDRQNLFFGPQAPFCTRTFLDLSLTTSLGFQVLLATLWRGGVLVVTGDSEATIKSLPVYKVQNMIGSPRSLLNFVDAIEKRPEYRCGLEAVFTAGSVLSEALSERVRARMCSNLTTGYGSTEATMVASMPAHFVRGNAGAAGFILPGINVEIIDDDGRTLQLGDEGIVRIKSEYAASGYVEDPKETARVFRDGWFYPGDLGYLRKDNVLIISGRTTNVMNLGGEKMNPERIEAILLTHENVAECGVLAVGSESGVDELCALVVPRSYLDLEELRDFCQANLAPAFIPNRFIAVADLPTNTMGKIERAKLAELLKSKLN
jgi:acyl-CoA synthetase (AMP-forming)/AMP-acid ligase II